MKNLTEKTRVGMVFAIIAVVAPMVAWSVWVVTFANAQWFYSHLPLIYLVMGMAIVLVGAAIAVLLRADKSPTVKTVAACAILATAVIAPAQAGDPNQYEDYAAYNLVAKFWNWMRSTVSAGDIWQAISTSNQPTGQQIGGAGAATFGGPVPPPQGPATPSVYEVKQK